MRGQQLLEGGEHAVVGVEFDAGVTGDGHHSLSQDQRGHRVAPDEREATPTLAVLDGLEDEPVIVTDELEERRHRRLEIGQHLGPHRDDGVLCRQLQESVGIGTDPHVSSDRKKQVRSPVWQAPRPCWVTPNNRVSPSQS